MTFRGQLVCMFFPGGLLVIIGGAMIDYLHGFGVALGSVGFLLLIAWPIFTITVHIRHERRLKRAERQRDSEPVSITQVGAPVEEVTVRDPLHTFVATVENLTFLIGIPVTMLGGLGVFCLVTAPSDPGKETFKVLAGIGSLGLLGAYLLLIVRGRSAFTLKVIGAAVTVFGIAGALAVGLVLKEDGITSVSDVVMAVASVVMIAGGLWLAFTGRNTFKRVD
ncbi:hypothetical protein [Brevibacterium aurantiacum]|uniref:hypothetical protein n=1 Tax=Brevibacterium aurantiacum TaxID=273384 RepID=UPI000F645F11|nr:hypothetical protein [Brevibacterium aurantiacum]